jgi:hypothetical protein
MCRTCSCTGGQRRRAATRCFTRTRARTGARAASSNRGIVSKQGLLFRQRGRWPPPRRRGSCGSNDESHSFSTCAAKNPGSHGSTGRATPARLSANDAPLGGICMSVGRAARELVAERERLLLDQHGGTLDGSTGPTTPERLSETSWGGISISVGRAAREQREPLLLDHHDGTLSVTLVHVMSRS